MYKKLTIKTNVLIFGKKSVYYYNKIHFVMIIKKVYDEETRTQKIWYDSSMIYYTEMVEDENENCGNLFVVFKNGQKYVYKDVRFEDYLVFINGGTDASQGKTLNKVIKSKYDYEKIGDADMDELAIELQKAMEEELDVANTYFISGHRNITEEEFEMNYKLAIDYALYENPNAKFVVGDYYGVDIMAQDYLMDALLIDPKRVTVYHMFDAPRNKNEKITKTKGGFQTDEERDAAMTMASSKDIAFVRDHTKISGTGSNILRRYLLKTFN